MPDVPAGCVAPGAPARVSADSRPDMNAPIIASDGTNTIVAWSVWPGPSLDRSAWAEVTAGAVVAHGTFEQGVDTSKAQLLVVGGKFYLFQPQDALFAFDGTAWNKVAFAANYAFASGTNIFGISGGVTAGTSALVFDGTTVTGPTTISNYTFAAAAPDGGSGLGVVTRGSPSGYGFVAYSGSAWGTEATVGASPISSLNALLVRSGTAWGIALEPLAAGIDPPYTFINTTGTWSGGYPGVSSIQAFAGNGGTFALSSIDGKVALYTGSWANSQVLSQISADQALVAYGSGYLYLDHGDASFYSAGTWSAAAAVRQLPTHLQVSGTTVAYLAGGTIQTYRAGIWATEAPTGGVAAFAFSGTDVVAAAKSPGAMSSIVDTGGTWTSPLALPAYATSGPVVGAQIARAANGHMLAVWTQWDAGNPAGYASEFDGCAWGTPVKTGSSAAANATVAAANNVFAVTDVISGVSTWTGSALTTPVYVGSGVRIASDGTTFVATYGGAQVSAVTSTDGVTWSAPAMFDAGAYVIGLAGGPAGALLWTTPSSGTPVTAHVWHGGAWSDAATMTGYYAIQTCNGSVAATSALLVCASSGTALDAQLFSGGTWTDLPIGAPPALLANDGTDYRLDYGFAGAMRGWSILHAGAWSTPASDSDPTKFLGMLDTAGRAGTWKFIGSDSMNRYAVETATGDGAYGLPSPAIADPIQVYYSVRPFANTAGHTDAVLVDGHPTYRGVSILYVGIDL